MSINGMLGLAVLPVVTRELVRRGYTEAQFAKFWSGNFLRVFGEVETFTRKLKKY
jgi:membrane dipeptidase